MKHEKHANEMFEGETSMTDEQHKGLLARINLEKKKPCQGRKDQNVQKPKWETKMGK